MDINDLDQTQAISVSFVEDSEDLTDELDSDGVRKPVSFLKVLLQHGLQESIHPLYEGDNIIGRNADSCHVCISSKSLSKEHACIQIINDVHMIFDKGSKNKTRRGKLFLQPDVRFELKENDEIYFADVKCIYLISNKESVLELSDPTDILVANTPEKETVPAIKKLLVSQSESEDEEENFQKRIHETVLFDESESDKQSDQDAYYGATQPYFNTGQKEEDSGDDSSSLSPVYDPEYHNDEMETTTVKKQASEERKQNDIDHDEPRLFSVSTLAIDKSEIIEQASSYGGASTQCETLIIPAVVSTDEHSTHNTEHYNPEFDVTFKEKNKFREENGADVTLHVTETVVLVEVPSQPSDDVKSNNSKGKKGKLRILKRNTCSPDNQNKDSNDIDGVTCKEDTQNVQSICMESTFNFNVRTTLTDNSNADNSKHSSQTCLLEETQQYDDMPNNDETQSKRCGAEEPTQFYPVESASDDANFDETQNYDIGDNVAMETEEEHANQTVICPNEPEQVDSVSDDDSDLEVESVLKTNLDECQDPEVVNMAGENDEVPSEVKNNQESKMSSAEIEKPHTEFIDCKSADDLTVTPRKSPYKSAIATKKSPITKRVAFTQNVDEEIKKTKLEPEMSSDNSNGNKIDEINVALKLNEAIKPTITETVDTSLSEMCSKNFALDKKSDLTEASKNAKTSNARTRGKRKTSEKHSGKTTPDVEDKEEKSVAETLESVKAWTEDGSSKSSDISIKANEPQSDYGETTTRGKRKAKKKNVVKISEDKEENLISGASDTIKTLTKDDQLKNEEPVLNNKINASDGLTEGISNLRGKRQVHKKSAASEDIKTLPACEQHTFKISPNTESKELASEDSQSKIIVSKVRGKRKTNVEPCLEQELSALKKSCPTQGISSEKNVRPQNPTGSKSVDSSDNKMKDKQGSSEKIDDISKPFDTCTSKRSKERKNGSLDKTINITEVSKSPSIQEENITSRRKRVSNKPNYLNDFETIKTVRKSASSLESAEEKKEDSAEFTAIKKGRKKSKVSCLDEASTSSVKQSQESDASINLTASDFSQKLNRKVKKVEEFSTFLASNESSSTISSGEFPNLDIKVRTSSVIQSDKMSMTGETIAVTQRKSDRSGNESKKVNHETINKKTSRKSLGQNKSIAEPGSLETNSSSEVVPAIIKHDTPNVTQASQNMNYVKSLRRHGDALNDSNENIIPISQTKKKSKELIKNSDKTNNNDTNLSSDQNYQVSKNNMEEPLNTAESDRKKSSTKGNQAKEEQNSGAHTVVQGITKKTRQSCVNLERQSTNSQNSVSLDVESKKSKGKSKTTLAKSSSQSREILNSTSSRRKSSLSHKPKVMFTGLYDEPAEKIVKDLGGEIATTIEECTHLVTDKIRRTVKFLSGLSKGIPIVSPLWLENSKRAGTFLDGHKFIVSDPAMEKQYKFTLTSSIKKAANLAMLKDYKIYVTKSVKPDPEQMQEILLCAGAEFLKTVPNKAADNTIVISCLEDKKLCQPAMKVGIPIVGAEFVLTGVLRQEVDIISFSLFTDDNQLAKSGRKKGK